VSDLISELNKYREQQATLNEIYRKGCSRTTIAQLVGVTPNTVRAWEKAVKMARGRTRARLLAFAGNHESGLKILNANSPINRGRISKEECQLRVLAMKEAGLWPLDVCARKLKALVETAKAANITTDEIIELVGIGRRTFYDYLNEGNTRLMSVEVVGRLQSFLAAIGTEAEQGTCKLVPQTLEVRFSQASIILFEEYCILGFVARDVVKEDALRKLAEVTGYNQRTLRRYLPLRAEHRRTPRAMVEAFEDCARLLGSVVRSGF
jgi:transcriptional regulator with XRE-family HTH domain